MLDIIGYWEMDENGQSLNKSDNYNAIVYHIEDEGGSIAYSQIPFASGCENEIETWGWENNYLDLEYYQGEPKDDERILTGISNYLKSNINLSFLMNTDRVMNAEMNYRKMIFPSGGFYGINEPLKLGGWTSEEVEKWKKAQDDFFERCFK